MPDIYTRTAIFERAGIFGTIGLYSCEEHLHAVSSFDPRYAAGKQFYRRSFETRSAAIAAFNESVAITRQRGFQITYNGPRNVG